MHPLTPLRWMSYMLIALGLINWTYQSSEPGATASSLTIIIIGAVQLGFTFMPGAEKFLTQSFLKFSLWIVSVAAVIFAIIN